MAQAEHAGENDFLRAVQRLAGQAGVGETGEITKQLPVPLAHDGDSFRYTLVTEPFRKYIK